MLEGNPAIDLQPIKGQYSSTKLQARLKVVRSGKSFHFTSYRIRFMPLKCTTTGHRKLAHNIFFILTLKHLRTFAVVGPFISQVIEYVL